MTEKSYLNKAVTAITQHELTARERAMVQAKLRHLEELLEEFDSELLDKYSELVDKYDVRV